MVITNMVCKYRTIFFLGMLFFTSNVFGFNYKYKEVYDFKTLDNFESVMAFETYYESYIRDCLNSTGGGTGGIPCFIAGDIWNRELNIYYEKLISKLDNKGKELLKETQRVWIKSRDLTLGLSGDIFWRKHQESGSMYQLMGAADYDSALSAIVKQRVLWLRDRLELLNLPTDE